MAEARAGDDDVRVAAYKVGAKLSIVVPEEPPPLSVVVDEQGDAWQNRPGPGKEKPWQSTTGEARSWLELVASGGSVKLVHLGPERSEG